jgi:hypothetical protein
MKRDKCGSGKGWDGGPRSRFQRLREATQLPLLLELKPEYDPRNHAYMVTAIGRRDGGLESDTSGILIYLDVTAEIAAGLRSATGEWIGEQERAYAAEA